MAKKKSKKKSKKTFVGKYVCYEAVDGGACWGRIKEECFINTMDGEKPVFILEDRYVRYLSTKNRKRFGKYYPDFDFQRGRTIGLDDNGNIDPDAKFFMEVSKVRGDSVLWKESINLEEDIITLEEGTDLDEIIRKTLKKRLNIDVDEALDSKLPGAVQKRLDGRQDTDINEEIKDERHDSED